MNIAPQQVLWHAHDLEEVPCDSCGNTAAQEVFVRPDGLRVVECTTCHLTYLTPRPKGPLISRLYENNYFQKATGEPCIGYANYLTEEARHHLESSAEALLTFLKGFWEPAGKQCLEIGCATGEFCQALSRHGASPIGLDLSTEAIAEAQKRHSSLPFRAGTIESLDAPLSYDALIAFEVIEHVPSPSLFFQHAQELLKPDGLLFLTTPNLENGRKVGFRFWSGFHLSFEHLYFFTHDSLDQLGKKSGFQLSHWFTGMGDAVMPQFRHRTPRGRLKNVLSRVGLLNTARKFGRLSNVNGPKPLYSPEGNYHNLLMIWRKRAAHG